MKIKFVLLFVFFELGLNSINFAQQLNITEVKIGLVACYPFNGNANDISGNDNNGIVNGAILCNNRFGEANKAYYFNGNSNIFIKNSPSLSIAKSFSFTIWFNADDLSDGQVIFAKSGDRNGIELKALKPDVDVNNGFCCPIISKLNIGSYIPKKWYFIAITFNGDVIKAYVNGALKNTILDNEFNLNYNMANEPLRIGIGQAGVYYPFKGIIDDFCVYNRPLSEQEIKDLFLIKF